MVSYPKEKHQEPKIKHRRPKSQKRTPELVQNILNSIKLEHLSLRKACARENIADGSFLEWVRDDETLAKQYAEAMAIRWQTMGLEVLDIADDVAEDDIFDNNGNRKANNEWIQRSKLRVDTRKWLLSKMMPKVYGDHIQIDSNSTASVTHSGGTVNVNISTDPVQASRDYQDFIKGKK